MRIRAITNHNYRSLPSCISINRYMLNLIFLDSFLASQFFIITSLNLKIDTCSYW